MFDWVARQFAASLGATFEAALFYACTDLLLGLKVSWPLLLAVWWVTSYVLNLHLREHA